MNDYQKAVATWKKKMAKLGGWIGVDLDGTLAEHTGWHGPYVIGKPIEKMVDRVKKWVAAGIEVRILTARATKDLDGKPDPAVIHAIERWCEDHVGKKLQVTNEKTYDMIELWDDRAVQVVPNTGERVDGIDESCCYDGTCNTCKEAPDEDP